MLVLLSVLASAYASAQDPGASLPPPPDARFALALYCNPTCEDSVLDGLDTALATIEAADEFSDRVARPQRIMGIGGTDFGIPDSDFVAAYGVEVDRPDELAASQMVLLAWFASPRERSLDTFAAAHAAFAAAAASTGGWVEDLDTQTLFGARAFAARDPRDVPQAWFVIEDMRMVEPAEGQDPAPDAELRLVTRGLRRYGDYELVVENVAPESAADVGWVLDAVATTLHPLGEIAANVEVATASARGIARLEVALPRDDDPTEHFLRVRFDGELTVPVDEPVATGGELTVPDAAAAEGSPSEAAAASVEPGTPRTLDEARDLVRERLRTELRPAFAAGLAPGEVIAVNVPYKTRAGADEYLWVEVAGWEGDAIGGRLATEPYDVPGLRKGDVVTVRQEEVYDYVWKRADGSRSGNLTKPFR